MSIARCYLLLARWRDVVFNRDHADVKLIPQDVSYVSDIGRLCVQWEPVAGLPHHYGDCASEVAMLALHDPELAAPRYVLRGDTCRRTDLPGSPVMLCVAGNGTTAADWITPGNFQASGDFVTAAEVASDLAGKWDTPANASTLNKITELAGVPRWDGADWPGDGAATILDWVHVESVSITSAVADVTLPTSGAFAAGYEYLIQFRGLTAAGIDRFLAHVDVGGGWITSASYTRDLSHRVAGTTGATTDTAADSTVLALTAGSTPSRSGNASGWLRFNPSAQAAGRASMQVESNTRFAAGTVYTTGVVWLQTPTNAALQRVLIYTTANITAGTLALYRRPI